MPVLHPSLRPIVAFVAAWIVLVTVGIAASVQFIIAELGALGAHVPLTLRLAITGADVINMAPLYGSIFGVGLLIAMIIAWGLIRWGAPMPGIVYPVAGFVAVAATLFLMKTAFGLGITPIAATRSASGFFVQCAAGALAGYVFFLVWEKLKAQRGGAV